MLQELHARWKYVVQNMPSLNLSSQRVWVRHSALGVCSRKENLDSTVDWNLIPFWATARSAFSPDFYWIFKNSYLYILWQGRVHFAASDEESGECRTHAHTFPTSSHCPRAAEPCCAAFEPQGGTKGTRQPSGITSSSPLPWVSTELLLFTTRYAVIRLRSRECVASLPPVPVQRHLRSGTARVA